FFALVISLLIMAGCFLRMLIDGAPALLIKQTLAYVVLLYFLPCLILGIWGLLIAQWNQHKSVFLPAMLVWLLTSTLNAELTHYTREAGLGNGGLFLSMLNMGVHNFHIPGNYITVAPIELPHWIVRIGILALLLALFLCVHDSYLSSTRLQKHSIWIITASVVILGTVMMALFYQNYSIFFARFADPLNVQDYVQSKHNQYIPGYPVSLADFPTEKRITLTKTEINLTTTPQGIRANVTIEANIDTETNGQAFTLYSDLVVDEVWVDEKKAVFQRSHDGLMVHFPNIKQAGDSVRFEFRYHGYSLPIFPANETTVQLHRSFPWIPWPGIKMATNYMSNYSESEDFFIRDWQRGDEVEYTLRYQGPGNIYTNLEHRDDNVFQGVSSSGVSFYSGMLHYSYRDVDIYVPANQYKWAAVTVDALLDAFDPLLEISERIGTTKIPEMPRSIVIIQMTMPVLTEFGYQQELYSWNDEWEIRQYSATASMLVFTKKKYEDSLINYQTAVMESMAVPYILSPSAGYPIHVSPGSTRKFATWLSLYLRAPGWEDSDRQYSLDLLREFYSGRGVEWINNEIVEEIPLTEQEENWIGEILDRMHAGENFDEAFEAIYLRLLQGELITASDIVSQLYHHPGE
ncbi:MAG TPA: hypothetical protein VEA58_05055, partial [Anaerovoracaceae bacterium]|nr:hypothetical protein [Anaerovoracaceae bacterium]